MAAAGSTRPLQVVIMATGVFGAVLVLMPDMARRGFGLLVLGDSTGMEAWPAPALSYVTLLHGVLGAVMVGWALALLLALRAPVTPRGRWVTVAVSVGTWFVIDTTFSALMSAPGPAKAGRPPRGSRKVAKPHFLESAWPNVALNVVFGAAFGATLWLARPRVDTRVN